MPPSGPPTANEIVKIAQRTTDIIQREITSDVCLVGSAAAFLWADIGRVPRVRGRPSDLLPVLKKPLNAHAGCRYPSERVLRLGRRKYQSGHCPRG